MKETVCLDLGSTVMKASCGQKTAEADNPQRKACPDVLGRTRAPGLHAVTVDAVNALIGRLTVQKSQRLTVTGNTVMLHILLDADPSGMAEYPYTPAFTAAQTVAGDAVGINADTVQTLPCASAFIGADVVAGFAATCGIPQKCVLYLDLGTNGEIVLARGGQLYALSTAAGSALGPRASQNIEAVAERLRNGSLCPQGEKRTRALQLAKAAVAAGVYTVLDRAAVKPGDVDAVFAAGGLKLRPDTARTIGLLPSGLPDPEYVGNAALAGAERYAAEPAFRQTVERIAATTVTVLPSNDPAFEKLFVKCMTYPVATSVEHI